MSENLEIVNIQEETANSKSLEDGPEKVSLLPRSAWKSQVTYLKVLLKAKQSLNKRG